MSVQLAGADKWFAKQWADETWEPDTHDILRTYLSPGDLFIDIGAWIGPVTRWALDLGATVHAYEPDPIAYQALLRNINGGTCFAMNRAVSRQPEVHLAAPEGNTLGDSNTRIATTGIAVPTITPERVLHDTEPALIKIDVEGYETEILQDFLDLATCPIWISWHMPLWPVDFPGWNMNGWVIHGFPTAWGSNLLTRTP